MEEISVHQEPQKTLDDRLEVFSTIVDSLRYHDIHDLANAKTSLNGHSLTLQDYIFFHVQTVPLIASGSVINRTTFFNLYDQFPDTVRTHGQFFGLTADSAIDVSSKFNYYTWSELSELRDEYDQMMRVLFDISTKHFLNTNDFNRFFEHYISSNYPFISDLVGQFVALPELKGLQSLEKIRPKIMEIEETDRAHKSYSHDFLPVVSAYWNSMTSGFKGTLAGKNAKQQKMHLYNYISRQNMEKKVGTMDALRRQAKAVIPLLSELGHEYRTHYLSEHVPKKQE